MRPILLHGHTRPLTQIKYNSEGDLLFTAGKDKSCNVWFSDNGERLGSYDGHNGVIWSIDTSYDCKRLLTGSGDYCSFLWDLETGRVLEELTFACPVRCVGFSYSGQEFFLATDALGGKSDPELLFYDARDSQQVTRNKPWQAINMAEYSKATAAVWGPRSQILVTGHDNGDICHFEPKTGDRITVSSQHSARIHDLQNGRDGMLLISSSKDMTAKLIDPFSLDPLKEFKNDRPVNSAAISPLKDHIVLGGGQEAQEVTTTAGKVGKFEAKWFHMVFEEEFARVKGHFGPINTIAIHPDGRSYSSGGEEGFVRIHHMDDAYLDYTFEQ